MTTKNDINSLMAKAEEKFQVDFESVKIGDSNLQILQIQNLDEYLERLVDKSSTTDPLELPFWAKIWPASILLSYSLTALKDIKTTEETSILELGAGIGLCGLYAASLGFRTTITDNNKDALLFARINALKNGLEDKVEVCYVDMAESIMNTRFDYILGSEILYIENLNRSLVKFICGHLKPEGRAILSADYKRQSRKFFKLAEREFKISQKTIGYKEKTPENRQEKFLCNIYNLQPKNND
ncbi:MAG: class I SAM-dependent methyltransferase [Thermodesulfobacteriota bacterium]